MVKSPAVPNPLAERPRCACLDGVLAKPLVCMPPHTFRLLWERLDDAMVATEPLPDLARAPDGSVPGALTLAGMGEAITIATEDIAARPEQFCDLPPAGDTIHHARADEIGSTPSESTGDVLNSDVLLNVLPVASVPAIAVGKDNPPRLGAQRDPCDALAVARPLPAAVPSNLKAAAAMQSVDIERSARFHRVAPEPASSP
jgi:hypothetical protein